VKGSARAKGDCKKMNSSGTSFLNETGEVNTTSSGVSGEGLDQDELWFAALLFIGVSVVYVCFVLVCGVSWEWRDRIPRRTLNAVQTRRDKKTWVLIPSKRDYDASEMLTGREEEGIFIGSKETDSDSIY
jgi:hypothetical protein